MIHNFLIFALVITFWSLSLYFYNSPVLLSAAEWFKIVIALTIVVIFELFYIITITSQRSRKKVKIPLIISFIFGLAIILTIFLNKSINFISDQYITFFLLLFIYGALVVGILMERSMKSESNWHLEATYLLVSFGILITSAAFFYIFLPFNSRLKNYLWLGPLFTLVFLLFFILGFYLIRRVGQELKKRREAEILADEWGKLTRAKDQFILSLQHHLRTPLTPMKGYLEKILNGTYGQLENPVIREKLIEIKKLTDNLYSLMESLLDVQELKIGGKILNLESCQIDSLITLIKSVIEELKPEAEQKDIYLKFQPLPSSKGKLTLKLDKKRFREAIRNLVDNAVKYTNRGGVSIKLEVENGKLKIIIADTGIGMEKEEINYFLQGRLFERGKEAKKVYGPGRGIGLNVAIEAIKGHDGIISAESSGLGKGTTFYVELPLTSEYAHS